MTVYDIRFNYRRLKADMKLEVPELPALFKQHFNVKLTKSGIYAWFERGSMPLDRLAQLLTIVMIESARNGRRVKLNIWKYIEATPKTDKKAA